MQPENPAQLGGKIYEMMGMALSGKWSAPEVHYPVSSQAHNTEALEAEVVEPGSSQAHSTETLEAEVVEPVEAGGQK